MILMVSSSCALPIQDKMLVEQQILKCICKIHMQKYNLQFAMVHYKGYSIWWQSQQCDLNVCNLILLAIIFKTLFWWFEHKYKWSFGFLDGTKQSESQVFQIQLMWWLSENFLSTKWCYSWKNLALELQSTSNQVHFQIKPFLQIHANSSDTLSPFMSIYYCEFDAWILSSIHKIFA